MCLPATVETFHPSPPIMPRRNVATPTPPPKIRLGSIYLTQRGFDALERLVRFHGHGPSGTIDAVLVEAAADLPDAQTDDIS
jgi:hypothetical protein